ncbi:MAG: acyl-CoA carboxylase subunit beta [Candidatus Marinimicrobia bacterium]|nr:acyl-CoA carboxylase subunit beta [Candidatus Neomarinimicrobiota bacterium]MCF7828179.1 acyl-CoA carboxylase subunit beta [Candidatus Neomarinimicrobiota bacterium]MCF7879646.1 acyl-CoA carboxylase subunit beta [Candidatus Neomarinimicrobiota bacterium]
MRTIGTPVSDWDQEQYSANRTYMEELLQEIDAQESQLKLGGGQQRIDRQHSKGRLTARERINLLTDEDSEFTELSIFAAWEMYEEYGGAPASGTITGVGIVAGKETVIVANDATVKAGAYFEVTLKKTLRAQEIALENNLPIVYLVDSAGVFLPLQDQVFPDEKHFGRIFFNNARLSAEGVTQIAAVMGPCVAGGAYLPVMCDKFIMVEGASMFLAGPALVKAAIGQDIDEDTLGGATTHNAISGTADYHEEDDESALNRVREILRTIGPTDRAPLNKRESASPTYDADELNGIIPEEGGVYDMNEVIARIVDNSEFNPYKDEYGKTLICGHARIGGYSVGIVANQKTVVKTETGQMQMGGVVYNDSADKAARFIMNCSQDRIPLVFLHDVNGFMVGRDAEHEGIAKDGAKMVNAVSNAVVPKFTVVIGGSYGAGNYAMSGRAYDPRLMLAWPTARIAVMGGESAAKTLAQIRLARIDNPTEEQRQEILDEVREIYETQSDPRYAAARIWIDAIIRPAETRDWLIRGLNMAMHQPKMPSPKFGVLQV